MIRNYKALEQEDCNGLKEPILHRFFSIGNYTMRFRKTQSFKIHIAHNIIIICMFHSIVILQWALNFYIHFVRMNVQ